MITQIDFVAINSPIKKLKDDLQKTSNIYTSKLRLLSGMTSDNKINDYRIRMISDCNFGNDIRRLIGTHLIIEMDKIRYGIHQKYF